MLVRGSTWKSTGVGGSLLEKVEIYGNTWESMEAQGSLWK